MGGEEAIERLVAEVRASGLIPGDSGGVVLLSGGADSSCATAAITDLLGPESVAALHVNYGLRPDADAGERAARALCAKLRIDLHIERPRLGEGNLQARAREARYRLAEDLRARRRGDWIATGHTRTDLAETLIYRLAVSPGSRALVGMRPRSGWVVRPLLGMARPLCRELARAAELPFADDPTNLDPSFARNRIRSEVLPVLAEIGPEVERNVAATHAELLEEAELLSRVAAEALEAAGVEGAGPIRAGELEAMEPALRRIALRQMAEAAGRGPVAIDRERCRRIVRLAASSEGGTVELGRGLRALCEAGTVRFVTERPRVPDPVTLAVPGEARFGDWRLRAELADGPVEPAGPERATLDAAAVAGELEVRAWREGDRMRPLGLGGSKSLQDLFTDAGVPRSLRRRLPVVVAGDRIAWVAGVAVGEEFRLDPEAGRAVVITAHSVIADEPAREG